MGEKEPPAAKWVTYEVIVRDASGDPSITPFSGGLTSAGQVLGRVLRRMRMLQDLGLPAARLHMKDKDGRRLIVSKDDRIWLLKCKPTCWRLYFYVYKSGSENRIIYVWAVCKKQDD